MQGDPKVLELILMIICKVLHGFTGVLRRTAKKLSNIFQISWLKMENANTAFPLYDKGKIFNDFHFQFISVQMRSKYDLFYSMQLCFQVTI